MTSFLITAGPFPDLTSLHDVRYIDITGNSFTGVMPLKEMPSSLTTLLCGGNFFSSGLSLETVPPNLVTLNLTKNAVKGTSISISNLTLNRLERLSDTLILDITSTDIICPFPGISDITAANPGSNLVIFKDSCRTELLPYLIPALIVLAVLALLVSIVSLVRSIRERLTFIYTRLIVVIFIAGHFVSAQVGRVFDILSYVAMYTVVTTPSPDNCNVVNNNRVYLPFMEKFGNGGVNDTEFPFTSCQDPTSISTATCTVVHNDIGNFTVFITYLLNGWPGLQFPGEVKSRIRTFEGLCNRFVIVDGVQECKYNSIKYSCQRVRDGALEMNSQFLIFIYVSIALIAVYF